MLRDDSGYYIENELEDKEWNQGDEMRDTIAIQVRDDDILDYSGSDDSGEKGMGYGYIYFRSQVDVIASRLDMRLAERDIRKKEKLREIL